MTDVGEIEVPAYDPKIASAMVHATKTRIDATKWVLAKMLPKLYGVAADLPSGGTVNLNMNLGETTGADA
jgi:hypothetical protein